jgi:diguanylate cyclase (GGDEF)-like protein
MTPQTPLDEQELAAWLLGFAGELKSTGVLVAEQMHHYLLQLPGDSLKPCVYKLFRILFFIQGFLYSYEMRESEKRFENFRAQSWFVPEFIRDLVVLEDEDEGVFYSVAERLQGIGLNNVYMCLLPEPEVQRESGSYSIPDRVLLAAYLSGSKIMAYPRSQMPMFDALSTLRNLPDLNSAHLICFSIFSGDVQYGILLCQADKEKVPLLHVIGLQLGILINFLDLKSKERIVGRELEHIRERIEILNFLSEYDTLCNVFNRRGFIERAIRMNRDNVGKHAICVFMDMDHLKEINDNFGHSSGDDVLCVVSDILKRTVRSGDLVARIGGDEFVGMFITDNQDFDVTFRTRLKEAFDEYNRTSGKPYYVEVSMGVAEFICRQGLEISKIINDADCYLYEEKKHRRQSALK